MNQKVSTGLGTAILLVMAFTAGYFVWMIEKNNQQTGVVVSQVKLPVAEGSLSKASSKKETALVFTGKRPTGRNADLYGGSITVEGEYSMEYPETMFGGVLFFQPSGESRSKLPVDGGGSFIFENDAATTNQMFKIDTSVFDDKSICRLSGKASIVIEGFTVELFEGEIVNHTKLVQVLDATSQTTELCSALYPSLNAREGF